MVEQRDKRRALSGFSKLLVPLVCDGNPGVCGRSNFQGVPLMNSDGIEASERLNCLLSACVGTVPFFYDLPSSDLTV